MATGSLADGLSGMREVKGSEAGKISSLSGHEQNPFFYNRGGTAFDDLSLISGADSDKDGRTFVLWDYDRDGFQDLAVVNSNAPRLAIYRNQLASKETSGHFVFLRFVGSNTTNGVSTKKSNRDGYGCVVTATVNGRKFRAEHHCGAGFAAENSSLMHIGTGPVDKIDSLTIRWPSGAVKTLENIPANSLVTCTEEGSHNFEPYQKDESE